MIQWIAAFLENKKMKVKVKAEFSDLVTVLSGVPPGLVLGPLLFLRRCMQCRRGLAMRILSVCLSVTRVHCDKTVERSVQIYIPYERTFIPLF